LIVQNVPAKYTKEMLMLEWPRNGAYNFIFVPYHFKQKRAAGHAFINFTSHDAAVAFYFQWHRKFFNEHGANRALLIKAATVQGLEANLDYFRDRLRGVKNTRYLPTVMFPEPSIHRVFNGNELVPL